MFAAVVLIALGVGLICVLYAMSFLASNKRFDTCTTCKTWAVLDPKEKICDDCKKKGSPEDQSR